MKVVLRFVTSKVMDGVSGLDLLFYKPLEIIKNAPFAEKGKVRTVDDVNSQTADKTLTDFFQMAKQMVSQLQPAQIQAPLDDTMILAIWLSDEDFKKFKFKAVVNNIYELEFKNQTIKIQEVGKNE